MAKTKISEFDVDPANNTDINSINIAEGCAPSGINNAIRQLMSDLKAFQTGADGDPFNGAVNGTVGATTPAAGAFTTLSASGAFSANGGATLGDASGDALTINSSAVSIPNGLNFGSNNLVLSSGRVFVGSSVGVGNEQVNITFNSSGTITQAINTVDSNASASNNYHIVLRKSDATYLGGIGRSSTNNAMFIDGNSYLDFRTGSTERMRITSAGNVGIGTSSPASRLQSYAGTGVSASHAILGASATGYWDFASGGASSTRVIARGYDSSGVNQIQFDPSGTSFLLGGNVGIGTSSPAVKLHVSGGSSIIENATSSFLRVAETSTGNSNRAVLVADATGMNLVADYGTSAIPMLFKTSNTERMRLDSSGNLGLGVTPSTWDTIKPIEIARAGNFVGGSGSASAVYLGANTRFSSSSWRYANNGAAALYTVEDNTHFWRNAASGTAGNAITFTQAMTLDASGNLGIGTTSPLEKLSVAGGCVLVTGNLANLRASSSSLDFNGSTRIIATGPDASTYPAIIFANTTTTTYAERMRIDSSGNLLVGITSTGSITNGVTVTNPTTATILTIGHVTGTGSGSDYTIFRYNGTNIGSIVQNGTTQVTYATSSDYRLKDNISPMTGALAKVAQLKPCTYTWKSDGSDGQGFIAHELQAIVPECVTGEKDAVDAEGNPKYQGIDTSFLVATLTAAIQELKAEVDSLKAQLNK